MMLVVFPEEEQAFWALVCAVDTLGVEHYYTDGMRLLRADIDVFESVLAKKCPKVYEIIEKHDVQVKSVCTEWFVTWFAKALPSHTVLRVWDTLFYEGFKVLFRVALGIFKRVEPEVCQCDSFEAIMERAKKNPRKPDEQSSALMKAFKVFDTAGTGEIDVTELQHIVTSLGERLSAQEFQDILRAANLPATGKVNYKQLVDKVVNA